MLVLLSAVINPCHSVTDDIEFSYDSEDDTWKERETKYFQTLRDKNSDGVLNREEIELWLYPPNTDPCVNEAKHLIYHADVDKVKSVMFVVHEGVASIRPILRLKWGWLAMCM